jgi:hypothetical protein
MKIVRASFLALASVVAAGRPAIADPVVYQATFDTVSYFTFSDIGFCGGLCLATSTVRFESSTGFPALTADFSVDKELHVTYSAPAGQRFVFDPPADAQGADLLSIVFSLWFGDVSAIGVLDSTDGVAVDFSGMDGSLTQSSFSFVAGHANGWFPGAPIDSFAAFFRADANGPWSFESVSATFTVPAIYDEVFNGFDPVVSLSASALWQWFGFNEPSWTEPAVWGRLAPVAAAAPEPGAMGLVVAGALSILWRQRRRTGRRLLRGRCQ